MKKAVESRTIWANLIIAIIAIINNYSSWEVRIDEAEMTMIAICLSAIVNIALRFATTQPIKRTGGENGDK